MVAKGQFLERPAVIPVGGGDEVMEGLSHRGDRLPPLLVVPPRPEEGGGMDHVIAAEVAWAAAMAGHPTLRFNHRGVGASQGKRPGTIGQLEDVEAALRVVHENAQVTRAAVVAIGGGAFNVLELCRIHPGICGVGLLAPVGLALDELARFSRPLLVVVGQADTREPRAALSAAVTEAGGLLEVVPEADLTFTRNLPEVGKAVVRWLSTLG